MMQLLNFPLVMIMRAANIIIFILLDSKLTMYLAFGYDRMLMTAPNMMTIDNARTIFFEIIYPEALNYLFRLQPAKDFGTSFHIRKFYHSRIALALPADACSPLTNRDEIQNSIALVHRGSCSFLSKATTVEMAGGIAMFVMDYDKENDNRYVDMVKDNTGRKADIPSGFILGRDGYHIQRILKQHGLQHAIINIPVNVTTSEVYLKQPPWTIW